VGSVVLVVWGGLWGVVVCGVVVWCGWVCGGCGGVFVLLNIAMHFLNSLNWATHPTLEFDQGRKD
jgi:hypothetical protein